MLNHTLNWTCTSNKQNLQAESIQASLAGKNVVVATMTSSGKSLCYNVPVLEVLSHNPLASALYLFPTKVCFHRSDSYFHWFMEVWFGFTKFSITAIKFDSFMVYSFRQSLIDLPCMQALAQDQLRSLLVMTQGLDDSLNIGIYDGDTSQEDRLWLRDNARLVF